MSIKEEEAEEWSDFDLHHENEYEEEDDSEDKTSLAEDDDEYVYNDENIPNTELKKEKKISGGFRYRKRKSTLTANFIFGRTGNNV